MLPQARFSVSDQSRHFGCRPTTCYPIVLYGPLRLPPILPHDSTLYAWLRDLHTDLALPVLRDLPRAFRGGAFPRLDPARSRAREHGVVAVSHFCEFLTVESPIFEVVRFSTFATVLVIARHQRSRDGSPPSSAISRSQLICRSLRRRIFLDKASRLYEQKASAVPVIVEPQYGTDRDLIAFLASVLD